MSDFVPPTDSELVTWANNINAKLDSRGAALGMTVAEIAAHKVPCNTIISAVATLGIAKTTFEGASTTKTNQINTSVAALRALAKDIKGNSGYTETIGREFGIVGSTTAFDSEMYKSSLKVVQHPGYVTLKFTKSGADGINLYTRIKGELNWTKLGSYSHSPCIDARPLTLGGQAENREYMCIGLLKDQEIGLQSDIASIAFAG